MAGQVGRPHGLNGDVYVVQISDDPSRFAPGSTLEHEDGRVFEIESTHLHGDRLLVKFRGVGTREEAERMRGTLFVSTQELRALNEGEYWHHDLIGCTVQIAEGERIGEIRDVIPGVAQDLLLVATATEDRLIPLVKEIVTTVDLNARVVVVDPPEGLL